MGTLSLTTNGCKIKIKIKLKSTLPSKNVVKDCRSQREGMTIAGCVHDTTRHLPIWTNHGYDCRLEDLTSSSQEEVRRFDPKVSLLATEFSCQREWLGLRHWALKRLPMLWWTALYPCTHRHVSGHWVCSWVTSTHSLSLVLTLISSISYGLNGLLCWWKAGCGPILVRNTIHI